VGGHPTTAGAQKANFTAENYEVTPMVEGFAYVPNKVVERTCYVCPGVQANGGSI
jgi:hypothetical protein